ncbi:MAG TPA: hypothetical protein VNF07_03100 [Acidimicrobiales bacterium]|nr:hypothetical protein [Acidimicrobiales bacterium]
MAECRGAVLDQARRDLGLSHRELFLRYFTIGGMSSVLEVEAFLSAALEPADHDYDVIAQALNERFVELGGNHPVAYSDSGQSPDAVERPGAPGR